jgi:hypothetical protein
MEFALGLAILIALGVTGQIYIVPPSRPYPDAANWECAAPLIKQRLADEPIPLPRSQTPTIAHEIAIRCANPDKSRSYPAGTDPRIIQLDTNGYLISRHAFEMGVEFCLNLRGKCNGMRKR